MAKCWICGTETPPPKGMCAAVLCEVCRPIIIKWVDVALPRLEADRKKLYDVFGKEYKPLYPAVHPDTAFSVFYRKLQKIRDTVGGYDHFTDAVEKLMDEFKADNSDNAGVADSTRHAQQQAHDGLKPSPRTSNNADNPVLKVEPEIGEELERLAKKQCANCGREIEGEPRTWNGYPICKQCDNSINPDICPECDKVKDDCNCHEVEKFVDDMIENIEAQSPKDMQEPKKAPTTRSASGTHSDRGKD